MSISKHPPSWLYLCIFGMVLVVLSASIVRYHLFDSLLFVLMVPCVLAAFYYSRWVYRAMLVTLVGASIWVTSLVSHSFTTSLITIAVAGFSGWAMAEMARAAVLARAQSQGILDLQGRHSHCLAEMGMALLDCDRTEFVFDRLSVFLSQVIPDAIIIVNEATPDQQSLVTRRVIGLDGPLWAQAERLVGFKVAGKVSPIVDEFREYFTQTRLHKIAGGFSALAASEIPVRVGQMLERVFGLEDAFTIGIADRDTIWGNVHIITYRPSGPRQADPLPARIIEAGVYQCFSTLSRIHALQELIAGEKKYRQLFRNLTAGFAFHEIILDEHEEPCDYRFLEVNAAFEALTGLRADEVVGRTLLEVLPAAEPHWIETYGRVAKTGESVQFENYIQELGRYYQVSAYAPEPGSFATIFLDVTELRRVQNAQQIRLRYEAGLAACSHALLAGTPSALTDALGHILHATGVSRVYLFENLIADGDLCMRQVAEACAPGIEPQIDNEELQRLSYRLASPRLPELLAQADVVALRVTDLLPQERSIFEAQGILSLLAIPLHVAGTWHGFIGFDDCVAERDWEPEDIRLLHTAAEMISRYLEQKRAQAERQRLIDEQRLLLNTVDVHMWYLEDAETFGMVNDAYAAFLDRPRGAIEHKCLYEVLPAAEAQVCVAGNRQAFADKAPLYAERWAVNGRGERRALSVSKTPHLGADGDVEFVVCAAIDITEQKLAEEALREKSEEIDRFFTNALDLLCIVDAEGHFRRLNVEWEKVLGYPLGELEGRRFLNFVHPDDLAATLETLISLVKGHEVLNFTNRYRCSDGSYRWIEWRSFPAGQLIYAAARDITERRQIEGALRESQALLNLFFAQSLDGFFFMMLDEPVAWDATTDRERVLEYVFAHQRITRVNDAMLAQYRATEEQFLGLTPHDFFAHDLAHGGEMWRAMFDAGRMHVEVEERKLDGTPMWVEGDYVCLYDSHGRITGHFGVQRDVTEQRTMLDALRDQERFVSALNGITIAALESSNLDDVLKTLAARMGEIFGADGCYLTLWDEERQLTVAGAAYGALHDSYRTLQVQPGEPTLTAAVLRTGQTLAIEDVFNTPYLSRRIAGLFPDRSLLGLPLIAGERKLGAALIAYNDAHLFTPLEVARGEQVARQISLAVARVRLYLELQSYAGQLEDRVRARTVELQAQYSQLDAILRSAGDAICMTDSELRILYVNPAFTTLTGFPADEVLGCAVRDLKVLVELAPRLPSIVPTLLQGRLWHEDTRVQRRDGRSYDAALILAPIHDDTARVTGYVFTHRDISQAKDLEHARNQFITNVSHQFRTPLTPLRTGIYLLQRAGLEEKHQHRLQAMQASIDWLIQLIQDTEEVLALDSGKGVAFWAPVSVAEIVEEVTGAYHGQSQAAGVTLEVAAIPHLPQVLGDAERLAQALSELVENAVVFTPAGGHVSLTVQADVVEESSWVTVAVRDTGPGVTPAEVPRLFERFFRGRLAESGHTTGAGLGLSIAQKIAEAHGGRITVESAVGQGSTFTLWLRSVSQEGGVT